MRGYEECSGLEGVILAEDAAAFAAGMRRPEAAIVGRLLEDLVQLPGDGVALADVLAAVGEQGRWSGELRTRGREPGTPVWDVTLTPIGCPEPVAGGPAVGRCYAGTAPKMQVQPAPPAPDGDRQLRLRATRAVRK